MSVEIRPQGETHHPHSVGPPPIRNQVRSIQVNIDATEHGLRFSMPVAQGWAVVATSPEALVAAIKAAFTEAQIAAYARWRNGTYDLADLTSRDDPDPLVAAPPGEVTRRRPRVRRDQYNPADWRVNGEGRFVSPTGRSYAPDSNMAKRIRAMWQQYGIGE